MLSKYILGIVFYVSIVNIYAQTISVVYKEHMIIQNKIQEQLTEKEKNILLESVKDENLILVQSGNASIYFPAGGFDFEEVPNKIIAEPRPYENPNKIGFTQSVIYKDLEKEVLRWELTFLSIDYSVRDGLSYYDWKIYPESKKILNYICRKAVSLNNNEIITAWFTNQINIKNGPGLYNGLPGLILELKTEQRIIEAIHLNVDNISSEIIEPKNKADMLRLSNFMQKAYGAHCIECEEKAKVN